MQSVESCFKKIKKDCFKFIKSQETSKAKFEGKDKMIKSFLIPICFWISKRASAKKPYFLGLAGALLEIQKQIGIKKDLIILSFPSNFSLEVS